MNWPHTIKREVYKYCDKCNKNTQHKEDITVVLYGTIRSTFYSKCKKCNIGISMLKSEDFYYSNLENAEWK